MTESIQRRLSFLFVCQLKTQSFLTIFLNVFINKIFFFLFIHLSTNTCLRFYARENPVGCI